MQALLLSTQVELRCDHPLPTPVAGEALVRVRMAGICNTDLELIKGYRGFRGVLGHELVGELVALPAGFDPQESPLPVGARVVAEINCVLPGSLSRTAAERAHDLGRTTLGIDRHDGAFAEYVAVPLVNLHRVPDAVPDDEAVFAEPLAAACQVLAQVPLPPTARVCVLGDGKLGLLCAQVVAAATACELLVLGRHEHKLALLRQCGIATLLASTADPAEKLRTMDVVIECTGSPAGLSLAHRLLRPRGTLVLKSTYAPPTAPHAADALADLYHTLTRLTVDEITVIGSRCGPFDTALRLLEQRRVHVRPLISARYPLAQGVAALAAARTPRALKVLLEIGQ